MSELILGFFQSLIIFLFFLYVCQLIGRLILLKVLQDISLHDDHSTVIGFFSLVVIFSTIAIMIPPNLTIRSIYLTIFYVLLCLAILYLSRKFITIVPRYDVVLLIQIFVFTCLGLALLRYHSSPDNHGLAATVSYLRENINFHALQDDFTETTQSEIPAHLGQRTSILDSTWNIADARLRFTADTILGVGRLGIALLISTLIIPTNVAFGFAYFVIFLGLFIVWASVRIIQDIHHELSILLYGSLKPRSRYLDICVRLFFVFSPLFLVMVLEGAINQLILLLAISWQLMIQLKISKNLNMALSKRIFSNLLGLLFTAYCYPHGIPYVLLMFVIGILLEYSRMKPRNVMFIIKNIMVVLLVTSLPLVILLRHTFFPILKSFLSGVSGVPYNLGSITVFDSTFWATSNIKFESVLLPGSGFENLKSSYEIPVIICGFLTLFVMLLIIKSQAKLAEKLILISLLIVVFVPVIFSVTKNNQINPYIYVRYLALYLVITIPFLLVVTRHKALKDNFKDKRILLTIVTILQLAYFIPAGNLYLQKSVSFVNWTGNFSTKIFSDNSIFVSDTPMHSVFSLTNFGKLNYLTDNWNPRLNPENKSKSFDVYRITINRDIFEFERIGKLTIDQSLDGPISYEQIRRLMFIQ